MTPSPSAGPKRRGGMARRVALWVLFGAGGVFAGVLWMGYVLTESLLQEQVQRTVDAQVYQAGAEVDARLGDAEAAVRELAARLSFRTLGPEEARGALERTLEDNPTLYGSCAAFSPASLGRPAAPYLFRRGDGLTYRDLSRGGYDYRNHPWYLLPQGLDQPCWSEPYFDEGGGEVLMTTFGVPFRDAQGRFAGVVTGDVALEWLSDLLRSLSLPPGGVAFLLSGRGKLLAVSVPGLTGTEDLPRMREGKAEDLRRRMVGQDRGTLAAENPRTGEPGRVTFGPLPTNDWSLGVFVPRSALTAVLVPLHRRLALVALGGVLFLAGAALLVARSVVRPVKVLEGAAQELALGHLLVPVPEFPGDDEPARLARALETARKDLLRYLEEQERDAAERARSRTELDLAARIQKGLLPAAFPRTETFAVAGRLEAAREVGGDLYDAFLDDRGFLFLAMGDVAGKGIPAALFMAAVRTGMGVLGRSALSPARILERLNDQFSRDNDTAMFVTLFLARVDPVAGRCVYASAGHPAPVRVTRSGAASLFDVAPALPVGAIPGTAYRDETLELGEEELWVLFTDGVTEAFSPGGELFGVPRLEELLRSQKAASPEEAVDRVVEAVVAFEDGQDPSDDRAVLAVRLKAPDGGTETVERL